MTSNWDEILKESRFPVENTKDPTSLFLIQLNSRAEKDLNGVLVSDALAHHISEEAENGRPITHLFLQTHGWNTTAKSSVHHPFGQFISGMMDDTNKPSENFNPMFVCFNWEGQPSSFIQDTDALTRDQLIDVAVRMLFSETKDEDERELNLGIISRALNAARQRGTSEEAKRDILLALADELEEDDVPRMDVDSVAREWDAAERGGSKEDTSPESSTEDDSNGGGGGGGNSILGYLLGNAEQLTSGPLGYVFKKLVGDPLCYVMFGRLLKRGRKTGLVMAGIMSKLMLAAQESGYCPKVTLVGNSAGAHPIASALNSCKLPYKIHACVIYQGAIDPAYFTEDGEFGNITEKVAGPIVCTVSKKDKMLGNIYNLFYDDALGWVGFAGVKQVKMKSVQEFNCEKYDWKCGAFHTIEGTDYIKDGDNVVGGHSDFKDNEATMMYWNMVNLELDPSLYEI